jgi:pimeloyl-ACP methyl ester carboxylesterase
MDVTRPDPAPSTWQVVTATGVGRFGAPSPHMVETSVGPVVVRDAGGRGLPIVLLHGWFADGLTNWLQAFQPLAQAGYRPVAIDMPGHGGSPLVGRFSFDRCATAVAEVIGGAAHDHAKPARPAILVGYSMGGPISQTVARDHPAQVAGLVEIATAAHIIPSSVNRGLMGGIARAAGVAEAAGATLNFVSRFRRGAPSANRAQDLGAHVAWTLRATSKRALLEAAGELARFDSRPWIGAIDLPAESIVTVDDRAVPPASQRELAALLGAGVIELRWGHVACLRPGFGPATTDAVSRVVTQRLRRFPG